MTPLLPTSSPVLRNRYIAVLIEILRFIIPHFILQKTLSPILQPAKPRYNLLVKRPRPFRHFPCRAPSERISHNRHHLLIIPLDHSTVVSWYLSSASNRKAAHTWPRRRSSYVRVYVPGREWTSGECATKLHRKDAAIGNVLPMVPGFGIQVESTQLS